MKKSLKRICKNILRDLGIVLVIASFLLAEWIITNMAMGAVITSYMLTKW